MPDVGTEGDLVARLNKLVDRVDDLESRSHVTVGQWRIWTEGALLKAVYVPTGAETVLAGG